MPADASTTGALLDIDGVLYVGEDPIEGAREALGCIREATGAVRLITNTTSRSRRDVLAHLNELGFAASLDEVITPAATAVAHCRTRGHARVVLLVGDSLREDLAELPEVSLGEPADAIVLGDLGDGFTPAVLNAAFRTLLDGAELIALQHNRYWRRGDGLALDVGAYAAALEYATGVPATVVGKPSATFFDAALADLPTERAFMVGDDVEADVGGALTAGLPAVLVRTGKFRQDALEASGVRPSAIVDSIRDVPDLLDELMGT